MQNRKDPEKGAAKTNRRCSDQSVGRDYDDKEGKNMFCPKCGHKVSNTDSFCPNCGEQLSSPVQKTRDAGNKTQKSGRFLYCPNCGAELSGYAEFCPKCGTRVRSENAEKIREMGNEGAAKIREAAGKGAKKVSEAAGKSAERVTRAARTGTEKAADFKKKGSQKFLAAHTSSNQKFKRIKWKKTYTIVIALAVAVIVVVGMMAVFMNKPNSDCESAINNAVEFDNMLLSAEITDAKSLEQALELILPASLSKDSSNLITSIQSAIEEYPELHEELGTERSEKEWKAIRHRIKEINRRMVGKVELKKINSTKRLNQDQLTEYQTSYRKMYANLFNLLLDNAGLSDLTDEDEEYDDLYDTEDTIQKIIKSYNDLRSDASNLQVSDGYNVRYTRSFGDKTIMENACVLNVDGSWVFVDLDILRLGDLYSDMESSS